MQHATSRAAHIDQLRGTQYVNVTPVRGDDVATVRFGSSTQAIIYNTMCDRTFAPPPRTSGVGVICTCFRNNRHRKHLYHFRAVYYTSQLSNFSLIPKIIELVVKSRLLDHLTSNKLLNARQSAYCKHHPTETALLYICELRSSH